MGIVICVASYGQNGYFALGFDGVFLGFGLILFYCDYCVNKSYEEPVTNEIKILLRIVSFALLATSGLYNELTQVPKVWPLFPSIVLFTVSLIDIDKPFYGK